MRSCKISEYQTVPICWFDIFVNSCTLLNVFTWDVGIFVIATHWRCPNYLLIDAYSIQTSVHDCYPAVLRCQYKQRHECLQQTQWSCMTKLCHQTHQTLYLDIHVLLPRVGTHAVAPPHGQSSHLLINPHSIEPCVHDSHPTILWGQHKQSHESLAAHKI